MKNLKRLSKLFSKYSSIYLIIGFFALIYCSISLVNHYNLRTYALDLGVFNHALAQLANFKNPEFTLGIDGVEMSYFATHFSLLTVFYIPLFYFFGSYSCLLVQILSILLGGWGVYKIGQQETGNENFGKSALIHFYSIWGIYSALSFDFHNNVVGSMLLPWLWYFLIREKYTLSLVFTFLILFAKEVMAIWLVFIFITFLITKGHIMTRKGKTIILTMLTLALIYGYLVINHFMPGLQGSERNLQLFKYQDYGTSLSDIVANIFKDPSLVYQALFVNTTGDSIYNNIKLETHMIFLLSGGLTLIMRPAFIIMLFPIYAQKFLSNDIGLWGINNQYSIELVPILSLALIYALKDLKRYKIKVYALFGFLTFLATILTLDNRLSKWYSPINSRFYQLRHFETDLNVSEIKHHLKLIPNNTTVSAQSNLAPYLLRQRKLYHFPIVKDAAYIALILKNRSTYPISPEQYFNDIENLRNSTEYIVEFENEELIIFKKIE